MPSLFRGDGDSIRQNAALVIIRLVQLIVAIIVLGITASSASDFSGYGCHVPPKLGYNIACAVITFLIVIYLTLSGGPRHVSALPWNMYIQFGLTAFLFVLWIAAAATSTYNCNDICTACKPLDATLGLCGISTTIGGQYCSCSYPGDYPSCPNTLGKRGVLKIASREAELQKRAYDFRSYNGKAGLKTSKIAAKQGADIVELILFLVATVYTAFLIFKARRGPSGPVSNMPGHGNFGMQQQQFGGPQKEGQADSYYNRNAGGPYGNTSGPSAGGQYAGSPISEPSPASYNYPVPGK